MSSANDLRTDLQRIPTPAVPMDQILSRGRALKRRRTLAVTSAALISVAVLAVGIDQWTHELRSVTGPAPGPVAPGPSAVELDVFLLDGITVEQRRNVRTVARDLDGMVSVRYVSKSAAYRDFKEQYRDEPEYWENLPMDALPAYFVVVLDDGSRVAEVRDRLQGLSGVDDVLVGRPSERHSADAYPLVAQDEEMRVFAPTDQPYGLCPANSAILTSDDLPAAEDAALLAASEISGGLDTTGAFAEVELATTWTGSPDFAEMIEKDCDSFEVGATALVTLHLPAVDSASMGATTYFVSHEPRGWVIWGAW